MNNNSPVSTNYRDLEEFGIILLLPLNVVYTLKAAVVDTHKAGVVGTHKADVVVVRKAKRFIRSYCWYCKVYKSFVGDWPFDIYYFICVNIFIIFLLKNVIESDLFNCILLILN